MTDQSTSTALALPEPTSLAAILKSGDGLDGLLSQLETAAREEASSLDATSKKGRDAMKSLAYRVSQSKAELDRQGLALTEAARKEIDAVNAGRRSAKERLDALRDEVKKPAIDWEAAEEQRVARHKEALSAFDVDHITALCTVDEIRPALAAVEASDLDESWEEFQPIAEAAKERALKKLRADLATAEQREAEQAELARLRAAEEERQRVEAEKREAEEEAKRQAEEAAAAAAKLAERAENARAYINQIGIGLIGGQQQSFGVLIYELETKLPPLIAELGEHASALDELRATTLAKVNEKMEQKRVEDEAQAERERQAAAEQAAKEAEERHQREMAEAKAREERAAEAERERIEAEKREQEKAAAKRAADKAHRVRILQEIADALGAMAGAATPALIAEALLDGRIPHVKVTL